MSTATGRATGRATGPAIDPARDGRGGARDRRRNRKRGERGQDKVAAATLPPRRRRRWPWIVALVTVLALLSGCVYAVFFSSLLSVRSVTITGADEALTAQVRSVVSVPTGTPLARVNLDAVASTVEGVAEVADVEVAREWPGTVAITVTPRVPVAVTSANGQLWLLDTEGDPYLTVDSPPPGLVTVQLAAPGRSDLATQAALAVVTALTPDFKSHVAVLSARTEFDVELTLIDRKKVIWGEPTENARKMQMLPALLAARDGTEYDITDPTLATVR
ncbi:MAG TPA: FtsQ-type POTRA domain-containing protein [Nakamurella sp.]